MPSNPVPRAALTSAEGALARPALRRRVDAAKVPPLATPTSPTDVLFGPAIVKPVVAVPSPAGQEVGQIAPKGKGKKAHKGEHVKTAKSPGVETVDVVVSLTKPVRRALKAAAADRHVTPEALAGIVLTAWLDR